MVWQRRREAGCKGLENDASLPERAWLGEPAADADA
jgi:hypothetical protein